MRGNLQQVIHATLLWTVRWAALCTVVGAVLMLAKVSSPADSGPQPNGISEYSFWILLCLLTTPIAFVITFIIVLVRRDATPKTMTRTKTMVWSAVTILGSVVLVFCGLCIAFLGMVFSTNAPHLWKGDPWMGWVGLLIAIVLILVAIIPARDSIRQLRQVKAKS